MHELAGQLDPLHEYTPAEFLLVLGQPWTTTDGVAWAESEGEGEGEGEAEGEGTGTIGGNFTRPDPTATAAKVAKIVSKAAARSSARRGPRSGRAASGVVEARNWTSLQ